MKIKLELVQTSVQEISDNVHQSQLGYTAVKDDGEQILVTFLKDFNNRMDALKHNRSAAVKIETDL